MKAAIILVFFSLVIQQPVLCAHMKEGGAALSFFTGEEQSPVWQNYDEIHPRNIVFLEGGGSAIIGSINYERMITNAVGLRIGYGAGIPLLLNYYIGEKYRFEIGAGVTYVPHINEALDLGPEGTTLLTVTLGHKYQPLNSGFILRFSMTPLYSVSMNKLKFWGGVSVGYAF